MWATGASEAGTRTRPVRAHDWEANDSRVWATGRANDRPVRG